MRVGNKWVSLNALHTFEAAGRHLHMRRASEELKVTQSAVSHQVRSLEASLGVKLFERTRRSLTLTPDGMRLLGTVQQALDSIGSVSVQLGQDAFSGVLTLALPRSFSTQWLMPRLPDFLERFPNLTVRCQIVPPDASAMPPDVDLAVLFDSHRFPGRRVETLVELEFFPVCAPTLALGGTPLPIEALRNATLIHEDGGEFWARWFSAVGAEQFRASRNVYVESTHEALALASGGAGFAINDAFKGELPLAQGHLVKPFGASVTRHGRYVLITHPTPRGSEAADAFATWLRRQVAASATRGAERKTVG